MLGNNVMQVNKSEQAQNNWFINTLFLKKKILQRLTNTFKTKNYFTELIIIPENVRLCLCSIPE